MPCAGVPCCCCFHNDCCYIPDDSFEHTAEVHTGANGGSGNAPDDQEELQRLEDREQLNLLTAREGRMKFRMTSFATPNVLLGVIQLVIVVPNVDKACSKPLATLLIICGVANICQIFSY